MNAFDMMKNAAANRLIEEAPAILERLLANIPPDIQNTIRQVGQIALSLKAQLDRIEKQQLHIMKFLDIPAETETKELTDGRE